MNTTIILFAVLTVIGLSGWFYCYWTYTIERDLRKMSQEEVQRKTESIDNLYAILSHRGAQYDQLYTELQSLQTRYNTLDGHFKSLIMEYTTKLVNENRNKEQAHCIAAKIDTELRRITIEDS